jgi:protein SCO1/2
VTRQFISILLLALALCACKGKPAPNVPVERYKLDGVVVSLNPQGRTATIDGQKVEGWMDAMTMDYPVKDVKELDSLHPHDHITATVFVQGLNFWIGEIHQVR